METTTDWGRRGRTRIRHKANGRISGSQAGISPLHPITHHSITVFTACTVLYRHTDTQTVGLCILLIFTSVAAVSPSLPKRQVVWEAQELRQRADDDPLNAPILHILNILCPG